LSSQKSVGYATTYGWQQSHHLTHTFGLIRLLHVTKLNFWARG